MTELWFLEVVRIDILTRIVRLRVLRIYADMLLPETTSYFLEYIGDLLNNHRVCRSLLSESDRSIIARMDEAIQNPSKRLTAEDVSRIISSVTVVKTSGDNEIASCSGASDAWDMNLSESSRRTRSAGAPLSNDCHSLQGIYDIEFSDVKFINAKLLSRFPSTTSASYELNVGSSIALAANFVHVADPRDDPDFYQPFFVTKRKLTQWRKEDPDFVHLLGELWSLDRRTLVKVFCLWTDRLHDRADDRETYVLLSDVEIIQKLSYEIFRDAWDRLDNEMVFDVIDGLQDGHSARATLAVLDTWLASHDVFELFGMDPKASDDSDYDAYQWQQLAIGLKRLGDVFGATGDALTLRKLLRCYKNEPTDEDVATFEGSLSEEPEEAPKVPKKGTAKAKPSPATSSPTVFYLEYVEGSSNKFYEVTVEGAIVTTRFGRIGAQGSSSQKVFQTASAARKFVAETVREKERKGYTRVDADEPSRKRVK